MKTTMEKFWIRSVNKYKRVHESEKLLINGTWNLEPAAWLNVVQVPGAQCGSVLVLLLFHWTGFNERSPGQRGPALLLRYLAKAIVRFSALF